MELSAAGVLGRVTFIAGPGRGTGKTTLLNHLLGLVRAVGERPAYLGIGVEGEDGVRARAPRIACRQGEVFVTGAAYMAASDCWPEILEALPGSSALGRLAVVRCRRDGTAVLVGGEGNECAAGAVALIRSEAWARTVLVDGALDRITLVSALPDARLLYSVLASPGDLERNATAVRRLLALAALPEVGSVWDAGPEAAVAARGLPLPAHVVVGPLTQATLSTIPSVARTVVVEDFTKVFLDEPSIAALRRRLCLAVRTAIEVAGVVVSLRDVTPARFVQALGLPEAADRIVFNPQHAGRAEEAPTGGG